MPIDISDYVRAQSEYYYVDKTLLIKEFLDQKPLVSLFTRPRRFGKTLNMDMLRVFFRTNLGDIRSLLTASLEKLSQMLMKHYGKAPIIIIDEYDTPIQEGYSKDFYDKFFGFTATEVRTMLEYYGVLDKEAELKDWYDGYLFGHTEIYNPW